LISRLNSAGSSPGRRSTRHVGEKIESSTSPPAVLWRTARSCCGFGDSISTV
jgi:hypothetical protein